MHVICSWSLNWVPCCDSTSVHSSLIDNIESYFRRWFIFAISLRDIPSVLKFHDVFITSKFFFWETLFNFFFCVILVFYILYLVLYHDAHDESTRIPLQDYWVMTTRVF